MDTQEVPGKWRIRKVEPEVEGFCWELTDPFGCVFDCYPLWSDVMHDAAWLMKHGYGREYENGN